MNTSVVGDVLLGGVGNTTCWCFPLYDTSSVVYPGLIGCFSPYDKIPYAEVGPPQADQTWVCLTLCGHLTAQSVSFCFNHSQWLLFSGTVMAFRWACPLILTSFRSLVLELASKPPASHLHRTRFYDPASLLCFSYQVGIVQSIPFECLINGVLPRDHKLKDEDTVTEVGPED